MSRRLNLVGGILFSIALGLILVHLFAGPIDWLRWVILAFGVTGLGLDLAGNIIEWRKG